jgi:hypothetical protein
VADVDLNCGVVLKKAVAFFWPDQQRHVDTRLVHTHLRFGTAFSGFPEKNNSTVPAIVSRIYNLKPLIQRMH